MNYLSVKEIAEIWNISPQMVRRLCIEGRVAGAALTDRGWIIPDFAEKPEKQEGPIEKPVPEFAKKVQSQKKNKKNYHGLYDAIQINLTYSSSRMASNRLTREQVEDLYRTNKLSVSFEPTKVDDIIEIMNHFICTKEMVDTIMEPLSPSLIRRYHYCLTYGTYADQKHQIGIGEYRKNPSKLGVPAKLISSKLEELIQSYENRSIDMDAILDFHVRFEKIHPFEDYNGRVGRLLMIKECLRYNIVPFIVDDKHRGSYNKGIKCWNTNPSVLRNTCLKAQERFNRQLELQKLLQRHKHREC